MTSSVTQGTPVALFTSRRGSSASRDEIVRLIQECDDKLHHTPNCFHTRAVRAHACVKARLWDHAVEDFTSILQDRPDDIHSRFSRGMALFKIGRVEEAHADFSRVLQLNPHHVMARYARAGCYNTEGKFHRAIEDYTIALQHDEQESEKALRGLRADKTSMQSKVHDVIKHVGEERRKDTKFEHSAHESGLVNDDNDVRRAILPEHYPTLSKELNHTRAEELPSMTSHIRLGGGSASATVKRARRVVQVRLSITEPALQQSAAGVAMPVRVEPVIDPPQLAGPVGLPLHTSSNPPRESNFVDRSHNIEAPMPPTDSTDSTCNHPATLPQVRRVVRRVKVVL